MAARTIAAMCFFVAGPLLCAGDVTYQETTKITGGSITSMMKVAGVFSKDARKLGQPIVTTVAIRGNKMLRSTDDSAQITDLDAKTITQIDKVKREYSVITFAQMKAAAERALEKVKTEQAKAAPAPASQPAKDSNVQVSFETHVRKTGAAKQISGLDTNEIVLTVNMNGTDKSTGQQGALAITNDMWMAPDIPAYAAVRDFDRKLALEMGTTFAGGPDLTGLVRQAQSSDELKAMAKEMSQIQGVPVLQIMRMGMTADGKPLPAASEAPLPQQGSDSTLGDSVGSQVTKVAEQTAQQTAAQQATQHLGVFGSSLGGAIGGFGGFGRKKKQPPTQEAAAPATPVSQSTTAQSSTAQPQAAVLVESATEIGHFADHVDPALLEIPAGFKLVVAPELKP